jgi:translation initiation factor IF-3
MDYSKYRYEQEQKAKLARKHQSTITIKEIKLRPKIGIGDYETKKGHVVRFLKSRAKVKVTIMFRGREVTHPERGTAILDRLAEELSELGVVEQRPMQEGRNMTMMMAPSKAVLAGRMDGDSSASDGAGPATSDVAGEENGGVGASAGENGAADADAAGPSESAATNGGEAAGANSAEKAPSSPGPSGADSAEDTSSSPEASGADGAEDASSSPEPSVAAGEDTAA